MLGSFIEKLTWRFVTFLKSRFSDCSVQRASRSLQDQCVIQGRSQFRRASRIQCGRKSAKLYHRESFDIELLVQDRTSQTQTKGFHDLFLCCYEQ